MNNETTIGIVSGYFNPLHKGHLQYINFAKKQCDFLVCIINNDLQVQIKGSKNFMDQDHRQEIMANIKSVDEAIISIDEDGCVARTIAQIFHKYSMYTHQFVFLNSGDRDSSNQNQQENYMCNLYNIKIFFINLPKICSSSNLKRNSTS